MTQGLRNGGKKMEHATHTETIFDSFYIDSNVEKPFIEIRIEINDASIEQMRQIRERTDAFVKELKTTSFD